jgi:hypothetical protein
MSIQITGKVTRNGEKKWYTFEWGKAADQRRAAGIFTYVRPKDQIQKNHNKEATALLETKRSQLTIEQQSIGTPFIPSHKFKDNFLDYYADFVENNKRKGNRHLEGSIEKFRLFVGKSRILPSDITENFCTRFRTFLLDRLTGKSPSDYFGAFKRVVKSATKDGYYRINPAEDVRRKKRLFHRLLKCILEDIETAFNELDPFHYFFLSFFNIHIINGIFCSTEI